MRAEKPASWVAWTSIFAGTSYVRALPDVGALFQENVLSDSPSIDFDVHVDNPGNYTLWVKGMAPDFAGDSIHVALNGQAVGELTGFESAEWHAIICMLTYQYLEGTMNFDEEFAYWHKRYIEDFGSLDSVVLSATRSFCEMATGQKAVGSILHVYGYMGENSEIATSIVLPVVTKNGADTAARAKALQKLGRKLCKKGLSPAYAVLIAEAWMFVMSEEQAALAKRTGLYPRPSEQKERKEVINTVGASLIGQSVSMMVDIIRNGNEILPGAETILPTPKKDNLLPAFFKGYAAACL